MKRLCLVLFTAIMAFANAFAQRPMEFDDIMKLKSPGSPQISPDGKSVAFTVSTPDMKEDAVNTNLWLVPANSSAKPRQLTRSPKTDTQPRWSPDGRWIAFLSDRGDGAQIYRIAPDGGEAEKLTTSKSPVTAFQWSPDGGSIAYISADSSTDAQTQRDKDKDDARVLEHEYRMAHLWVLAVESKKVRRLTHGWYTVSDP